MVKFVFLHWAGRAVPPHQDGEGRGGPGRDVGRGGGQVHLGLGGDADREAGEAGALLVVSQHPDGVGGAGQQPLQGDLLQRPSGGVDHPLSEHNIISPR